MALELEADHPTEIRARHGGELDDLDHRDLPGQPQVDAVRPDAELAQLGAERRPDRLLRREAEGGAELGGRQPVTDHGAAHVILAKRETDDVAHWCTCLT